jgi:hypothetical protein
MRRVDVESKGLAVCGTKTPSILFQNRCLERLASAERNRALRHLSLSTRAHNSLVRSRIATIGQLVGAARKGFTAPRSAGRKTTADIQDALNRLSESIRSDGKVDWEVYAAGRSAESANSEGILPKSNSAGGPALQVRSLAFDGLMPAYRESRLEALHLSHRACTSLRRIGINTVGELVDSVRTGIKRLPAAADLTLGEIKSALHALSRSIRKDGSVDWMNYASERGLTVLPKKNHAQLSPQQFLKILPEVMIEAVESRHGAKGSFVLRHYLLQGAARTETFERLGQRSGYTKQGVALIKRRVVTMLRDAILKDSYGGCRFRFRHSFVALFRQLDAALRIAQTRPLLYSEWQRMVGQLWRIERKQIESLELFFFDILNYHMVHPTSSRFQPIILPRHKDTSPFTAASPATEKLLRYHFPNGLSEERLLVELGGSIGDALTADEVPAVIGSVSGIERLQAGKCYRVRLDRITRVSDQLERILRDRGKPMHVREIAAKVRLPNRGSARLRTVHQVSSLLSDQKRFKCIANTGYWILREWKGFETRTIIQIAADICRQSKKPMTEAELYRLIAAQRSVRPRSIGKLLLQDKRFRRIAPRTWEFKATGRFRNR